MSAQLSYAINQNKAYAGMVYDQSPKNIISRAVETEAGIGFGVAVSRGTTVDTQCKLGGSSFIGITARTLDREGAVSTGAIKYAQKETAAILRQGYIWAVCPSGCVPGNAVNYVIATGVLDSGVAASSAEMDLDGATWETTAAAGELGVIRLETTASTVGS